MARPTKQGIDYFPLDCQFDDKIEMYLIEKGATGLGVLVTLWQMIYANEGYYIEDNNDLHLLIKRRIDVPVNEVSDCINACLNRNLFSQKLHGSYRILTSKAIQKRYFEAAKKKKSILSTTEYLLINVDSYANLTDSGINPVDVDGNATNVKEEVEVKEEVNGKVKEEVDKTLVAPQPDDIDLNADHTEALKMNIKFDIEKSVAETAIEFETQWAAYGKKGNRKTSWDKFSKVKDSDIALLKNHLPRYVQSTPELRFRKNFETYINQSCWNDEIIAAKPDKHSGFKDRDYSAGATKTEDLSWMQ